jgi:enoyl-CoA hydratase/carnithine racemase
VHGLGGDAARITIAAIEGYAIGGGIAFALACDWRVIAADAYVRLPEISLGFPLTWGTIPRVVNLAGPAAAKRIVAGLHTALGSHASGEQFMRASRTAESKAAREALEAAKRSD